MDEIEGTPPSPEQEKTRCGIFDDRARLVILERVGRVSLSSALMVQVQGRAQCQCRCRLSPAWIINIALVVGCWCIDSDRLDLSSLHVAYFVAGEGRSKKTRLIISYTWQRLFGGRPYFYSTSTRSDTWNLS